VIPARALPFVALTAAVALHLAAATAASAGGRTYRLTPIGPEDAVVRGINNKGQVIFNTEGPNGQWPYLWSKGKSTKLSAPNNTRSATATAINNKGMIVGVAHLTNGYSMPTLFKPAAVLIRTPEGFGGIAGGLNDKERVAATLFSATETVPAVWHSGGWHLIDGVPNGNAIRVNNQGAVLVIDAERSYVLKGEKLTSLGMLPDHLRTIASGMNDAGQVCGSAYRDLDDGFGLYTPFVWEKGKLRALPVFPEGSSAFAHAINNKGQIFGIASHQTGWYQLLWEKKGGKWKVTNLGPRIKGAAGWELLIIAGANDKGQIVGEGNYQGRRRSFLLTPKG
jgi:uncharacterized membrane protein